MTPIQTRPILRLLTWLAAAGMSVTLAAPAVAQEEPEYPPTTPTAADGICVGDIPYFQYAVDFGPNVPLDATVTITFVNPNGQSVIYTGQPLSGTVIWPGASENPQDWPGWSLLDGQWVEDPNDLGAYTRVPEGVQVIFELEGAALGPTTLMATALAPISVLFQDVATLTTTTTYPPATSVCANPPTGTTPPPDEPSDDGTGEPSTATPQQGGLAATGAQTAGLLIAGGGLLAGGTALVISSRRRAKRAT